MVDSDNPVSGGRQISLWGWLAAQSTVHSWADGAELFILKGVQWDDEMPRVVLLYKALKGIPEEDYLLVEACHDPNFFSEESGYDQGKWVDNPFGLCKKLSVSIIHEATEASANNLEKIAESLYECLNTMVVKPNGSGHSDGVLNSSAYKLILQTLIQTHK